MIITPIYFKSELCVRVIMFLRLPKLPPSNEKGKTLQKDDEKDGRLFLLFMWYSK
jgi:hypothetical protein